MHEATWSMFIGFGGHNIIIGILLYTVLIISLSLVCRTFHLKAG
jgi:hypothetical protein